MSGNVAVSGTAKLAHPYFVVKGGGGSVTNGNIVYASKDFDSHSAYNLSTNVFTAPVAGVYLFNAGASLTMGTDCYFQKSTGSVPTQILYSYYIAPNSAHQTNMAVIPLALNETVVVHAGSASTDYNDKYSGVMLFAT